MREIFEQEKLHECVTLAEQCFLLHSKLVEYEDDSDWKFSYRDEGLYWGITRQYVRRLVEKWKRVLIEGKAKMPGRPPSLSQMEIEKILDYVSLCDEKLEPLTQTTLIHWINITFNLSLTWMWLKGFIQEQSSLFVVDCEPLEEARTQLTDEQLIENAKELTTKLAQAHPELVMNMDETAIDSKRELDKLKVVSRKPCPRQYKTTRGESHITFVPTIGITGWCLPIMTIVKTISVVSELSVRYGFPKSSWAHVVTSSSAYINEILFRYWLDEIFVPGVEARRRMLMLPADAKALLIIDGCLCHSEKMLKELSVKFIDYHYLVPHNSHVTQPLDRGIFSFHKRIFKNTPSPDTENKVGKRIMRGLIAMSHVCTPAHIRSSFWRAGIELNYIEGKPVLTMNLNTWLTQRNSPASELKEEFFVDEQQKKRARTKTVMKGFTKKEQKEKDKREKDKQLLEAAKLTLTKKEQEKKEEKVENKIDESGGEKQ